MQNRMQLFTSPEKLFSLFRNPNNVSRIKDPSCISRHHLLPLFAPNSILIPLVVRPHHLKQKERGFWAEVFLLAPYIQNSLHDLRLQCWDMTWLVISRQVVSYSSSFLLFPFHSFPPFPLYCDSCSIIGGTCKTLRTTSCLMRCHLTFSEPHQRSFMLRFEGF